MSQRAADEVGAKTVPIRVGQPDLVDNKPGEETVRIELPGVGDETVHLEIDPARVAAAAAKAGNLAPAQATPEQAASPQAAPALPARQVAGELPAASPAPALPAAPAAAQAASAERAASAAQLASTAQAASAARTAAALEREVGERTVPIRIELPQGKTDLVGNKPGEETQVIRAPGAPGALEAPQGKTDLVDNKPGEETQRILVPSRDGDATLVMPAPVLTTPYTNSVPAAAIEERHRDHRPGFAIAGVLLGLAGIAAQLVPDGVLRLVLLLLLVTFGPGAAIMSFANVRDKTASWAMAVAFSFSATCGAAVLTFWTHVWNPAITLGTLTGATLVASVVQIFRAGLWKPRIVLELGGDKNTGGGRGTIQAIVPFAALVVSVGLWAFALLHLKPSGVGAYGFTAALGVPFVIGVVVLGAGFAAELWGRARPVVLALLTLVVPLFMNATVPLLDGTTEYAWTYKHIGVVDLIRDHGHIIDSSDIYQQWPGFFAVVAMISKVAVVDALSFAAWASLFFSVINMLMIAALLRQFTTNRRVVAIGVLISQAAMWVDIGYFSPQAFAYSLMLAFWVIILRWFTVTPSAPDLSEKSGLITRTYGWLLREMPPARPPASRASQIWAGAGATAIFAAITVSHQLTPFVMMVPLVVMAVLGLLRPRWIIAVFLVVVAAFVGPRLGSVSSQYSIFSFDLLSNASGNAASWNTPEQEFSAYVSRILAIGLWLAALVALWLNRKKLGTVLLPALLAFLPMVTLAGGNYGGEAIYRVFAFSLPFTGLLVARVWTRLRTGVVLSAATGLLAAAMVLAGLQGLQGQLVVHQVSRTDIKAASYFYDHATPDSAIVLVAPNFPTKLESNYGSFNKGHVSVDISLVGDPTWNNTLSGARLKEMEAYIRNMHYSTNYLVVSTAMLRYTTYFGYEPSTWYASLTTALNASTDWTVFYSDTGVTIYKLNSTS